MDEIISQIVTIDSLVYEDQMVKEEALRAQKTAYEKKLQSYKDNKLSEAQRIAAKLTSDASKLIEQNNQRLEESKQIIQDEIDKKYIEVKDSLIDKVMNKLFVMR